MTATTTRSPRHLNTPTHPTKLRDGSWGATAATEDIQAGDTVEITTRAGKQWTATIDRVLWTGDGKAICMTTSHHRAPRRREPLDHEDCLSFAGCIHRSRNCDYH